MAKPYTIVSGDTLTKIAAREGFSSWRDIYFHVDNAAFRAKRPNPDRIFPGDVLIIPNKAGEPVVVTESTQFRLVLMSHFNASTLPRAMVMFAGDLAGSRTSYVFQPRPYAEVLNEHFAIERERHIGGEFETPEPMGTQDFAGPTSLFQIIRTEFAAISNFFLTGTGKSGIKHSIQVQIATHPSARTVFASGLMVQAHDGPPVQTNLQPSVRGMLQNA